MNRLATLALLPALALGGAADTHEFGWLAGCWVTPDGSAQEVWVVDGERSLAGFGVAIEDNKVVFYEVLSIRQSADGSWAYTAHPSGQASASFQAIQIGKDRVVFANPDHDYPQEIRYQRERSRLYATTSLLDGVSPNSFDKIACE